MRGRDGGAPRAALDMYPRKRGKPADAPKSAEIIERNARRMPAPTNPEKTNEEFCLTPASLVPLANCLTLAPAKYIDMTILAGNQTKEIGHENSRQCAMVSYFAANHPPTRPELQAGRGGAPDVPG